MGDPTSGRPRTRRATLFPSPASTLVITLVLAITLSALVTGACNVSSPIGQKTADKSTQELVADLEGGDYDAAREAITVLAERKDPAAAEALAGVVVKGADPSLQDDALAALQAIGPAASGAVLKELEYDMPARPQKQLRDLLVGWARSDPQTVRLLIDGLGKKYERGDAKKILPEVGKPARGPLAKAMRSGEKKVRMRAALVLARMNDHRAVPVIVAALIDHRYAGGDTWDAAEAIEGPVVAKLVTLSRGGGSSHRATYVLLDWVLGGGLSKGNKNKARSAVIATLNRTDDTQLGFDMWGEGDAQLTAGAQAWAHSRGMYFHY